MKEEQNINMIETLINNNSFVMFRSRNYYADEITEYTSIKNNSKLLYNNYNDIYTDLLIGLNKFTYNSHIILETKTNDMIEYNYFNNDFTNKVTKMDTNNKDYIYWYNMRFSQLKNTKGKILFLRGDYNYSVEIVRNYEIIIFYSAGKLLDNVNYLHIDVIIKLMCKSIKEDIAYMHISNIEKKYDIDKNDLNDKIRLKFFEKIIYKDD